jgi:DNA-binding MarR family transcriptional regulator
MASDEALRLDQQVCFPLYAAANAMGRLYRPILEPLGLTYPQYLVMLVLWQEDRQSVSGLGALLHLDSGTLTPLLKRLEAAGLVVRRRDTDDERRVLISLTAAGKKLKIKAREVPEQIRCAVTLPGEDLVELRRLLREVLGALIEPPAG